MYAKLMLSKMNTLKEVQKLFHESDFSFLYKLLLWP